MRSVHSINNINKFRQIYSRQPMLFTQVNSSASSRLYNPLSSSQGYRSLSSSQGYRSLSSSQRYNTLNLSHKHKPLNIQAYSRSFTSSLKQDHDTINSTSKNNKYTLNDLREEKWNNRINRVNVGRLLPREVASISLRQKGFLEFNGIEEFLTNTNTTIEEYFLSLYEECFTTI